jgi:hypothetical protein
VINQWEERALPVLKALSSPSDPQIRDGILTLGLHRGASVGVDLPDAVIYDTVLQLNDLEYVEFKEARFSHPGTWTFLGFRVTGRGLQVLGEWPRFEVLISPATLAALIERLADYAAPEESQPMKRAAAVVRRVGAAGLRTAAIEIGAQLLRAALAGP